MKFWPLPSSVALRYVGFPLLPLHNFLLQKGRQRGLLWITCRKCFPYVCCLPHTPPTASAWSNQTEKLGGVVQKKSAPIIWHPILIYCAHIITVPAHIRNLVWAIWAGFGLFIPTEVPTEFYRVSNIAKELKVKQTGGLLLKAKIPQLYKHVIADDVHKKCKTCMGRGQASTHQISIYNISSQSHAWYMN